MCASLLFVSTTRRVHDLCVCPRFVGMRPHSDVYKVPLRDVVHLKSRGCRTWKRVNTGVPVCMSLARFAGVAPLLYCADVFEIQRKCGAESSLVVFRLESPHRHTQHRQKHRSQLSQNEDLEIRLLSHHGCHKAKSLRCDTGT